MSKIEHLALVLLTALLCFGIVACSDDDGDDSNNSSIVGLWKSEQTHDGGGYYGYEFKSDGRGVYYDDWENQGNVECFDYTFDATTGKLTMQWHADTTKENWDSPVTETTSCTVTILSNDRVRIVEQGGYTMFLVRQ